jgi:hypothetical protein
VSVHFDLAKEFKVDPKIIYNPLKTKANQHQAILELAKLKRENEAFENNWSRNVFVMQIESKLIG